jgi:hypothetical protein
VIRSSRYTRGPSAPTAAFSHRSTCAPARP